MLDPAADMVGEEHLLIGSDWPFPMGSDDPLALVTQFGHASADRISRANAAAFLGMQS